MNEAKGVAWTTLWRNGLKIDVTHRSEESSEDALMQLWGTIEVAMQNGYSIGDDTPRQPVPRDTYNLPPEEDFEQPDGKGKDWGLVEYMPKASELGFHDILNIEVDEYKYDGSKVSFYKDGGKYPQINHNMNSEVAQEIFKDVFNGWIPEADGERKPIPGGSVILLVECTGRDKQTSAGNPYRNIKSQQRPKEN